MTVTKPAYTFVRLADDKWDVIVTDENGAKLPGDFTVTSEECHAILRETLSWDALLTKVCLRQPRTELTPTVNAIRWLYGKLGVDPDKEPAAA